MTNEVKNEPEDMDAVDFFMAVGGCMAVGSFFLPAMLPCEPLMVVTGIVTGGFLLVSGGLGKLAGACHSYCSKSQLNQGMPADKRVDTFPPSKTVSHSRGHIHTASTTSPTKIESSSHKQHNYRKT
jgi:hypothetical protein